MSNDYTLVGNLNNVGSSHSHMHTQILPQHLPPQQSYLHPQPQQQIFPAQNFDKYDMIKKYLSETEDEDSDDSSDDENDNSCNCSMYLHMYAIPIIIILLIILWYVFKIRKELTSMYEA